MNSIIKYFTENFDHLTKETAVGPDIIQKTDRLNKSDRALLRNKLFERAKLFAGTYDALDIFNWLESCFYLIDKYSFRFNNVYFSPGTEIKESITTLLRHAHSSIDLCVFTITDNELAKQIIASHKKRIKVRIITDDDKTNAKGSEIYKLAKAGIPVKTDHSHYHMHNKFGIIDKRIAITGSFNWTYTATKHNQENLLATSNNDIVQQYNAEFKRLWDEMFKF